MMNEPTIRIQKVRKDTVKIRLIIFATLAVILLLCSVFSDHLTPYDPYIQDLSNAKALPSAEHLFGTDQYGRDMLSRVIIGSRTSIYSTLVLVAIITVIGTCVGIFCGWHGKWIDTVLMRISDVFLAFPGLVFALAVAGVLGGGLQNAIIALAAISWPKYARIARSQTLSLKDLTESVLLRAKDDENNDPQSFARLIVLLLMNYTKVVSPGEFGVLPFDVPELLCPRSIVFVNVERHARATPKQIADEWKLINNSVKTIPTMVSNQKLKKLTSAQRTLQKISSAAANAATNAMQTATKSARVKFSSKEPTTMDITRHVRKIMEKMAFVAKSMNTYKKVKATYAKPNRRDPDDFNKQGKSISTRYKPDIHLYIDTSGSISERNYEDIVKACILMAKKLNINLYFNSFSHIMSQTTKLNTKDKTREQIYNEFQRVPKVSGGTDYEQIWHFINSSKKRIQEISLLITDFEYDPPRKYVKHPKNLYYVPCSHQNWNNITYYANMFCQSMMSKDPGIRRHILF